MHVRGGGVERECGWSEPKEEWVAKSLEALSCYGWAGFYCWDCANETFPLLEQRDCGSGSAHIRPAIGGEQTHSWRVSCPFDSMPDTDSAYWESTPEIAKDYPWTIDGLDELYLSAHMKRLTMDSVEWSAWAIKRTGGRKKMPKGKYETFSWWNGPK